MLEKFRRRFVNGWKLGGEALGLIRQHPRLMIFPLLNAIALIGIIVIGVIASAALSKTSRNINLGPLLALWLFVYYWLWVTMIFLATALSATVLSFHASGTMSLREGFAVACNRFGVILMWAAFAATIGLLIGMLSRWLEQHLSGLGRWIGYGLDASWAMAVYFVVPILAVEGDNPIQAMKRSIAAVKSQWSDTIGIEASITWRLWPFHLVLIVGSLAIYLAPTHHNLLHTLSRTDLVNLVIAVKVLGVACAISFIALVALTPVMRAIARANLYVFAAFGEPPPGSDPALYNSLGRA